MSQSPNPGITSFLLINLALQAPAPYTEICYEKWIKEETRLDIRTGSRAEDTRQKESAREENRQDIEANRRRDTTKGIQSGTVSRLPGLKLRPSKTPWPPAMDGEVGLKAKYTGGTVLCGPFAGFEFYQGCDCQAR